MELYVAGVRRGRAQGLLNYLGFPSAKGETKAKIGSIKYVNQPGGHQQCTSSMKWSEQLKYLNVAIYS